MSLPFQLAVGTRTGPTTHLVLHSPRVQGLTPDTLNDTTLCCRPVTGTVEDTNLGDVECLFCLHMAPSYMTWPTFTLHRRTGGETP